MGFRFQKRIKLGKGFGVNLSKTGVTPSYRNKKGSVSSKGYSFRAGISGLTFRKTFSKAKNSGCLLVFSFLLIVSFLSTINSCKESTPNTTVIKWYQGGTLHKSKILDWKKASYKNKLATCGDFCANIYKKNSIDEIKIIATNLLTCIDETVKGNNAVDDSLVSEIASMCLILMEN